MLAQDYSVLQKLVEKDRLAKAGEPHEDRLTQLFGVALILLLLLLDSEPLLVEVSHLVKETVALDAEFIDDFHQNRIDLLEGVNPAANLLV